MKLTYRDDESVDTYPAGVGCVIELNEGDRYLISQVDANSKGSLIALISMDNNANRLMDPVLCKNMRHLSKEEMRLVTGKYEFKFVGVLGKTIFLSKGI